MAVILRRPLAWMIGVEIIVVAVLLFLGLRAWSDLHRAPSPPAAVAPAAGDGDGDGGEASGVAPGATPRRSPPAAGQPPAGGRTGAGVAGSGFLGARLDAGARDQAAWERTEWGLLESLIRASRAYLERVVVPAVETAAARGSSP